ncbi:hypothetical protein [Aeromonas aquatica]|uniref:hypothetical protein n=1 Tax=Aeromonas aquatica TaxID=558964 RepID=UPI0012699C30|nr:hypothetical protein [Aeromonas aquatica]
MTATKKLETIVDKYFTQSYSFYKKLDAKGENININFEFNSRADFLKIYLDYYRDQENLQDTIIGACTARFKIEYRGQQYELKHTHQEEFEDAQNNLRGVNNSILTTMASKLLLRTSHLESAVSFDDIFKIIKSTKVTGFGELSIYDTAVRISSFRGYQPTVVFLHAGTKDGVRNLERQGFISKDSSLKDTLRTDEFPPSIQKLNALQMENFLCAFKHELKNI